MEILIIGDVFSKSGRKTLAKNIVKIKKERKINLIICNGENISHGKGMNEGHYRWLLEQGVNVVTLGNHAFNQRSIINIIDEAKCLVRPYNYKREMPGVGYVTLNCNGIDVTVFQMLGQVFMNNDVDNPFIKTEELLKKIKSDIIICDFHAESTSEKVAFGYAFDGRLTCVYGTHTHVQTADEKILPKGTAYITDIGMTGSSEGVIGVKKEIIIDRFYHNGKVRFEPEERGQTQFCGIILTINDITHKATGIERINITE